MQKIIIFFFFFLTLTLKTYAQAPAFRHLGTQDGLPSNEVYKVLQDSKGYMWFTTDGGVCRYNGVSFKNYTTKNGLCDNTIFYIQEDSKHRIWFYGFSGKISYFKDDSIYTLALNNKLKHLLKACKLNSMYVDNNDTLWLGFNSTREQLCKIPVLHPENTIILDHAEIIGVVLKKIDACNFILFSTGKRAVKGFDIIFKNRNDVAAPVKIPVNGFFSPSTYFYCKKLKNNTYLLASANILIQFNEKAIIAQWDMKKRIISVNEDKNGLVWIGLWRGGVVKAKNTGMLSGFEVLFNGKSVSCVQQDHENGYWFTTLNAGIFYTPSVDIVTYGLDNTLIDNSNVLSLTKRPDGSIYFIMDDGFLYSYNTTSGFSQLPVKQNGKPFLFSTGLFADTKGNLWLSSNLGKACIINKNNNVNIAYTEAQGLCYLEDDNGTIWIGHNRGIMKFDKKHPENNWYINENGGSQLRVETMVYHTGYIYFGSLDGLWRFNTENRKYEYLGNISPLLKNRVADITEDADKNLLIATRGAGLVILNTVTNTINQVSEKNGLVSDICNTVLPDGAGKVWVGTNDGLSKITFEGRYKNYYIENYNTSHGLASNQVKHIIKQGSNLFLATHDGLTLFNPQQIGTNKTPPPIYITGIAFNETTENVQAYYKIPYNKNTVLFKYTGLSFKNRGKIKYKYILEGVDKEWVYSYNTSARYPLLLPGTYKFKVYASNNDGVWSLLPASTTLCISPPFWLTWWFLSFSGISIIIAIFLLIKMRINSIKEEEKLKTATQKKISEAELKALKARMNPHFIFNTINSIQHYIIKNKPDIASDYLSKYARLMRTVFDSSSEANITVKDEVEMLKLYLELEALRLNNRFGYTITVSPEIDIYFDKIPALLIQPFVENAIWHGIMGKGNNKGLVSVTFSLQNRNTLLCIVEDNGIGRENAEKKKGKNVIHHVAGGIQVTRERLHILNRFSQNGISLQITDLKGEQGEGIGTKVLIFIPIY